MSLRGHDASLGHAASRRALVLIGKPGTGKGTQGRILGAAPGLVHVAMGGVLRDLGGEESGLGRRVRQSLERGQLLPDDLVLSLFEQHVGALEDRGVYDPQDDLLVLDGIPRTLEQASRLAGHVRVILVVHLRCDDDRALFHRMRGRAGSEGRRDDRSATLHERLRAYARDTAPVLDHYPPDRRADVGALEHPLLVHDRILHLLLPLVGAESGDVRHQARAD